MNAKSPMKILCIGEPLREFVATVYDDRSLHNLRPTGFAGDMAPNLAAYARMAAQQLGVECSIDVLTAVGAKGDADSDRAVADLEARGLNIHPATLRLMGKTLGRVVNLKNPDGSTPAEKVRLDREHSAFRDLLNDASDADLRQMVQGYTHLVVSGIPLACVREREKLVKLVEYAREQGTQIIVSTNLRPSNWRMKDAENPDGIAADDLAWKEKAKRWMDRIIPLASVIFANHTDEQTIRQEKAKELNTTGPFASMAELLKLNPDAEIIVTNDDQMIHIRYPNGSAQIPVPPVSAAEIADTVGAGDSLAATYLIARQAGYAPPDATKLGAHIASQVVRFDGALPKLGAEPLSYNLRGIANRPAAAAVRGAA